MVEIVIQHHKERPQHGAHEIQDAYEWWTVESGQEYVKHLMPLHGAVYLNKEEVDLLDKLAKAHQWEIKLIR